MSEYQYYEFLALDRPLTEREMLDLRACSSRANITPSQFVNHYDWGDFKGHPATWMDRYFDAFLYLANWGTRELMLRFPLGVLDRRTAGLYCLGSSAAARVAGDFLILEFLSEDEPDDDWDDGSGWLSSLVALRADIAGGDYRALYLAWLLSVQQEELEGTAQEPPVPPGLGELSASLEAFAGFLRIDADLIAAASERSAEVDDSVLDREIRRWIGVLAEDNKTELLVRCAAGDALQVRAELLRRFRHDRPAPEAVDPWGPRTVAEITAAAERLSGERRRREAEIAAQQRARREREEAARREAYLDALAGREAESWHEVDTLIESRKPKAYDEAVRLLEDLRELGSRDGREADAEARIAGLCEQHARKSSFIARLRCAGLAN